MKNSTKLEKVKKFLTENNITYEERGRGFGHSDLWVPSVRVAIKLDGEDSVEFFNTHNNKTCYPLFIRDNDTPVVIIEKLQTLMVESMMRQQRDFLCRKRKEERLAKKKIK